MSTHLRLLYVFCAVAASVILAISCYEVAKGRRLANEERLAALQERAIEQRRQNLLVEFPADPTEHDLSFLAQAYRQPAENFPPLSLFSGIKAEELAPLPIPPRPQGQQLAKAQLGFKLFRDPQLSRSGQISCQNCHNRELGWGDGLQSSFGHDRARGKRNAPPLFNVGLRSPLFWDGRAETLEEQALIPMTDQREMANHDIASAVERIAARPDYQEAFQAVYNVSMPTAAELTDAIATFQRTLEEPTRLDRFLSGQYRAFNNEQIWGMHLFRTKGGCANCHNGPLLTDNKFHNLGLSLLGRPREDVGRYAITNQLLDVGRFRTPSIRHVSQTAPYMHNGIIRDLRRVVRFYEVGGGRTRPRNEREGANPFMPYAGMTSPFLRPFSLTVREREALIAFLEAI
ncbi:cytochrome-c peroxidase [Agrobacterium sp. AGB01]|uniref:cytochrome-c peroxidase n=1 Tax=Agrobacterium sp. AGB01 TaxID=2769302 RepID=UPI00177D4449|nr:cytochrome c peroxidase [Agrobacterium sp. AGB01]MBD9389948.1 cytochrome-c peroxidase [Agrobacterium sp. AGB01]